MLKKQRHPTLGIVKSNGRQRRGECTNEKEYFIFSEKQTKKKAEKMLNQS